MRPSHDEMGQTQALDCGSPTIFSECLGGTPAGQCRNHWHYPPSSTEPPDSLGKERQKLCLPHPPTSPAQRLRDKGLVPGPQAPLTGKPL